MTIITGNLSAGGSSRLKSGTGSDRIARVTRIESENGLEKTMLRAQDLDDIVIKNAADTIGMSVIRNTEAEDPGRSVIEKTTKTESIDVVIAEGGMGSVVRDPQTITEKLAMQSITVEGPTTLHDERKGGHDLDPALDHVVDPAIALTTGTRMTGIGNTTRVPVRPDTDVALLHQPNLVATQDPDPYGTHHERAMSPAGIREQIENKLQTRTETQTQPQPPTPTP